MLDVKSWNKDREKSNDDVEEDNYVHSIKIRYTLPQVLINVNMKYDSLRLMSFTPHLIWLCVASGVIAG